ncbi:hypothetical protein [Poseidonia sp.]|uniref:hypothetical protein n=1 Tax=Poseidonia sp. TaxID=2666344 RepID=UPI003F6A4CB1
MRLHAITGFSPMLLVKAMQANKWSEVVLYTSDQQALKKFFQNVKKLPPIKYIRISELNDANSVEDYLSTFRLAMSLSDGVNEDDVLFYSGPAMAIAVAFLMRGFSTYMTYNAVDRRFVCRGVKDDHFEDRFFPSKEEFLRLHGLGAVPFKDGDGEPTAWLEIKSLPKNGKQRTMMKNIKHIELTPVGIKITLHKPATSGQRKNAIFDIFNLRAHLGSHALKIYVDDDILAGWINGLYSLREVLE